MTNKTRKHIWPVAVMSLVVAGALAVVLALYAVPQQVAQAHECDDLSGQERARCLSLHRQEGEDHAEPTQADVAAVPGFTIEHGGEARQVSVDWDAVEGAAEYKVEYRQCEADPCSGAFTTAAVLPAATTDYLITGLNAGTQYQVRVTAYNTAGMVLARSSSVVSTSRYLLTFNTGTTPLRSDPSNLETDGVAGEDSTIRATVWVPETTDPDRTDTVTIQFMSMADPADPPEYFGIDVDDREQFTTLGLLAVSSTGTGHGELTIRPRDADKRSFDMTFACTLPATRVYVIVYDDEVDVVEQGWVTLECPAPPPPPPPDDEITTAECYSVTGYMGDDEDEAMAQMRDDIEPHERPAHRTNPEMGQDTIQILEGSADVQITVTSCEAGPVYIRFLDSDGDVFGTDIDECETCAGASGADVVGLDSQQKLELNLGPTDMDADMALMYDQYNVVTPGSGADKYLVGKPGMYHQGTFRFIAPCDWDPFEVEVYEKDGKVLQELENGMLSQTISCVAAEQPEQAEAQPIEVIQGSRADREMIVRWQPIAGAVKYTVAVLDTSDPAMYIVAYMATFDPSDTRETTVTSLTSGTRYIYAVYAELPGGTYSPVEFVINAPEF